MPRIAVVDHADMNAEQARVHDAAKAGSGIVGGPYYAYIRLPKLFEAAQNMRKSLSPGRCRRASSRSSISPSPGTGARAIHGSRRRAARSPSASRKRSSMRSMPASRPSCRTYASAPATSWQESSSPTKI